MKSNYQSTPNEHLESRPPKCTHKKDSLHVFFCILQLIYKENRTDSFSKPNRNQTCGFLKTEPNVKNPFRTSLLHKGRMSSLMGNASTQLVTDMIHVFLLHTMIK